MKPFLFHLFTSFCGCLISMTIRVFPSWFSLQKSISSYFIRAGKIAPMIFRFEKEILMKYSNVRCLIFTISKSSRLPCSRYSWSWTYVPCTSIFNRFSALLSISQSNGGRVWSNFPRWTTWPFGRWPQEVLSNWSPYRNCGKLGMAKGARIYFMYIPFVCSELEKIN